MEIIEFSVKRRATYETGADQFPYHAHIVLKDGGNTYQPDIRLQLTHDITEAILDIVNPIAVRALNKAAREFQDRVANSLTAGDQARLTDQSSD